jgi:hypothetical protein
VSLESIRGSKTKKKRKSEYCCHDYKCSPPSDYSLNPNKPPELYLIIRLFNINKPFVPFHQKLLELGARKICSELEYVIYELKFIATLCIIMYYNIRNNSCHPYVSVIIFIVIQTLFFPPYCLNGALFFSTKFNFPNS